MGRKGGKKRGENGEDTVKKGERRKNGEREKE